MGAKDSDTNADTATAAITVTANSRNRRPTIPPISSRGMKTAISDALMDSTARPQVVFVRGKGSHLWDASGKRYLDFVQGWAVNCLGQLGRRRLAHVTDDRDTRKS